MPERRTGAFKSRDTCQAARRDEFAIAASLRARRRGGRARRGGDSLNSCASLLPSACTFCVFFFCCFAPREAALLLDDLRGGLGGGGGLFGYECVRGCVFCELRGRAMSRGGIYRWWDKSVFGVCEWIAADKFLAFFACIGTIRRLVL